MKKNKIFLKLFLIIFFLLNYQASATFAKSNYVIYKIKNGDNLSNIAKRYKVSVRDLIRWNSIKKPNKLFYGKKLKIYKLNQDVNKEKYSISINKPVKNYKLFKNYNSKSDIKNYGIVYKVKKNELVYPVKNGKVKKISYMRGFGFYILVDHGSGWLSMYSNIDKIQVNKGDIVTRKNILGKVNGDNMFFLISHNGKPINPDFLL
ncbi:MAG: LysM peptidoglycan-binding domain-containing M23 family metallopeptidase [Spirochaetia bacterium]|nr:LysM peptidoglycan-binding domain-containing M23 family metallopeptidase [Spirochaetia bacterium]